MKDIESRLGKTRIGEPRRPLSMDFTRQTLAKIQNKSTSSAGMRLATAITGVFTMHKLTRPAALAIGLTAAIISVGTGYAAIKWLQPHSTLDKNSITTLPNGNIRFWVHSDSCQGQGNQETPIDSYYEIKAGSKITPEDVRDGVESACEADLLPELFPEVIEETKGLTPANFKPGDKQYFTPFIKLKEVGKDYIVTEYHMNGRNYGDARLPIDRGARFFAKGQPISLSEFKSGDSVTLISYTTSLDRPFATESMSPDALESLMDHGFPKGTRISGIIQRQYDPMIRKTTEMALGVEYTRLVPDKKSPDGWRQVIPFDHDWDKYQKQFEN